MNEVKCNLYILRFWIMKYQNGHNALTNKWLIFVLSNLFLSEMTQSSPLNPTRTRIKDGCKAASWVIFIIEMLTNYVNLLDCFVQVKKPKSGMTKFWVIVPDLNI